MVAETAAEVKVTAEVAQSHLLLLLERLTKHKLMLLKQQ